ncbi:MAG: redox-sensing transcriptional repressor Rex [Treponema sp.]|jgi:redox-sensing transcriptional repressor|nr:redox-sensing transcriptional repressor Rex [Treponema sp.]
MEQIPEPAKERLLFLMRILEKNREKPLTSGNLEALTGWSSHTIRKDISFLGGDYGGGPGGGAKKAGTSCGYNPETLMPAIKAALGLNRRRRFCVVGLGRLGSAYLNFQSFELGEFELAAGFDSNVNRVEILKSPVPLYPAYKIPEAVNRFAIEIALLCVPGEAAQASAEKLAAAGIRGIVNFAPVVLSLPPEVAVRNVYVMDELRALAVKISH